MSLCPSAIFKHLYIDAGWIVFPDTLSHLHRAMHGVVVTHESADESNHDVERVCRVQSCAHTIAGRTRTHRFMSVRQVTAKEKREKQHRDRLISHNSFIHQVEPIGLSAKCANSRHPFSTAQLSVGSRQSPKVGFGKK